jgi:hypothetical protein
LDQQEIQVMSDHKEPRDYWVLQVIQVLQDQQVLKEPRVHKEIREILELKVL